MTDDPGYRQGWILMLVLVGAAGVGSYVVLRRERPAEPTYLEGDMRDPAVREMRTETRLSDHDQAIGYLDEKITYLQKQLDEMKEKAAAHREALAHEVGAREKCCAPKGPR